MQEKVRLSWGAWGQGQGRLGGQGSWQGLAGCALSPGHSPLPVCPHVPQMWGVPTCPSQAQPPTLARCRQEGRQEGTANPGDQGPTTRRDSVAFPPPPVGVPWSHFTCSVPSAGQPGPVRPRPSSPDTGPLADVAQQTAVAGQPEP